MRSQHQEHKFADPHPARSSAARNPPALLWLQEMQVQPLDWEDPLEEGMANHSSILAWRGPWTGEPDGLQYIGSERVRHD